MIREFKEPSKPLKLGKMNTRIRVCEVCFGTKFTSLEGGQVKCNKCKQVYWV